MSNRSYVFHRGEVAIQQRLGARERIERLSIKRELPPSDQPDVPPGFSSSFFHDQVGRRPAWLRIRSREARESDFVYPIRSWT